MINEVKNIKSNEKTESIRIMTFNIWNGGESGGFPLNQTIEVILLSKADVVGIQESETKSGKDNAKEIAKILEWHYYDQGKS